MSYVIDNWQYMNQQEDVAGWKGMEIGSCITPEISGHCYVHPFIGVSIHLVTIIGPCLSLCL
jgi:hypothetical protein